MGQAQGHVLGRNTRFYAIAETTYGVQVKPTGASALKVLETNFVPDQERKPVMESRPTRSHVAQISGKKTNTWRASGEADPSGALGTAWNLSPMLKAALGVETVNAGVSRVYTLIDTQGGRRSMSLYRSDYDQIFSEGAFGSMVNLFKFSVKGGDEPHFEFAGFASVIARTGTSTLNGAMVASDQMIVATADAYSFDVGSIVQIGADTNTGAGYKVTAQDAAAPQTLTIETAISALTGAAVVPYTPTESVVGQPIAGINGSILVGGTSMPITAFEVSLDNHDKPVGDEAFSAVVTDSIDQWRDVMGSISFRARKDQIIRLNRIRSFITTPIVVVCGATAGSKIQLNVPQAEMKFTELVIPNAEEATITMLFRALSSSNSAADELSVTLI